MASYKQDLAPPGGYKDIQWQRALRKPVSGWKIIGGLVAVHAFGGLLWYFKKKQQLLETTELFDSRVALIPFYTAEQDRLRLKQLRSYRDYEAELMKDNPNWVVGEQLYHKDVNSIRNYDGDDTNALKTPDTISNRVNLFFTSTFRKIFS
ncbi:hypothetical protein ACF0H5_013683 [Mactra antiquata]